MLQRRRLRFLCVVACLATAFVVLTATLLSAGAAAQTQSRAHVMVAKTEYRGWNGDLRKLHIAYPSEYPELRLGERLRLVIALHGAGGGAYCDTSFGQTPARYRFVVACLEGQGAATKSFSYGAPGQIRDQLRLPALVHSRLPRRPLDPHQVIIVGASMGGLEALLAADLDPQLFAAVVALDAPVDLAAQYQNVAPRGEPNLKTKAMLAECGGTPELVADCYAMRSPLARMTRFGDTGIPLINTADYVVEFSRFDRWLRRRGAGLPRCNADRLPVASDLRADRRVGSWPGLVEPWASLATRCVGLGGREPATSRRRLRVASGRSAE